MPAAPRRRTLLVVLVALVVVAALVVGGSAVWKRTHRTPVQQALALVPAASLRVAFTDWDLVRRTLHADLGSAPSASRIDAFLSKAYDADLSAASSIDGSGPALEDKYGFGPATAQWEAYAQSPQGATMVLRPRDGTDFDGLARRLADLGYAKPKDGDGVWKGGVDLVASLDPTLTPELQYVVLLEDQDVVVTSDTAAYAGLAAKAARGDGATADSVAGVAQMASRVGRPTDAMTWTRDFACRDLAMSQADDTDQQSAERLVQQAGKVSPLAGLTMAMLPGRTLQVVQHFETDDEARRNLRPRATLAVGEAVGRGGSFSDDFRLTRSRAVDSDVLLDLRPRRSDGFVLSALYDGPLLFATC
ncbi:MAG: hypothetical protein JWR42_686 [Marmoricola sp.]|nr:hypothetical protein [Marmoricola sp.]